MQAVNKRIKAVFLAAEVLVLKVRDVLRAVPEYVFKKQSTATGGEDLSENTNKSESSELYDSAESQSSFCRAYTANYDGTTCIQQRLCSGQSCACCLCLQSISDFTKGVFGCFINLLCYPFIPCAVALLPTSFQFAGYSNTNSLYPCYGKTCCFCIRSQGTTGFWRICLMPQCCLVWLSLILAVACLVFWNLTQDSQFLIQIMLYFENVDLVSSVFLFILLFTLVSFPMMWGYVLLNLAAGYLYGFLYGILVVVLSVTVGLAVAHVVCKKYFASCVMNLLRKRSNFDQIEAILQVIDGKSGLKVISLTRLTPIPFGFQNGLFAVSNVSLSYYLLASNVGLLPTQILNCYIGSTFRSMEQLLDQDSPSGYLLFLFQVAIGVALMMFVIQRARKELAFALQNNSIKSQETPMYVEQTLKETEYSGEQLQEIRCSQPKSTSPSHKNKQVPSAVIEV